MFRSTQGAKYYLALSRITKPPPSTICKAFNIIDTDHKISGLTIYVDEEIANPQARLLLTFWEPEVSRQIIYCTYNGFDYCGQLYDPQTHRGLTF